MGSKERKRLGYLAVVRCSTHSQAGSSTDDQLRVIQTAPKLTDDELVDVIWLEGVSASNPHSIDQVIEDIIERKRTQNDFDRIALQDMSRLTRYGADHAAAIRYKLSQYGITIVLVTQGDIDPQLAPLLNTLEAEQNRFNKSAFNIARGLASAVADRRKPHCGRPPFGVDRLMLDSAGTPAYRIRNLSDGTQVKLKPDTDDVIDRYGRNPAKAAPVHHRKQKCERVVLVPGDPLAVETVGLIYRWRLQEDLGCHAIAKRLRSLERPAPDLHPWRPSAVESILKNPTYVGICIALRRSNAKIARANKDGTPTVIHVGPEQRTKGKREPQTIIRPAGEWLRYDEDRLKAFLPADVREAAVAHHEHLITRCTDGYIPAPPRRDAARESDFILAGVLRSARGGSPMTGTDGGRNGEYRYYRPSPRATSPEDRGLKRVPAEGVEEVALSLMAQAILGDPQFPEIVATAIRQRDEERRRMGEGRDALVREREDLEARVAMLMLTPGLTPGDIRVGLRPLEPRLAKIEELLAAMDESPVLSEHQVKELTQRLIGLMKERAGLLTEASPPQLKALIRSLICGMTIDPETCEMTVEVCVPDASDAEALQVMGPLRSLVHAGSQRTHQSDRLQLTVIRHRWPDGSCCRRKRRAA